MSVIDSIHWEKQSSTDLLHVLTHISGIMDGKDDNTTTTGIISLINWANVSVSQLEELKKHINDLILVKSLGLDKVTHQFIISHDN